MTRFRKYTDKAIMISVMKLTVSIRLLRRLHEIISLLPYPFRVIIWTLSGKAHVRYWLVLSYQILSLLSTRLLTSWNMEAAIFYLWSPSTCDFHVISICAHNLWFPIHFFAFFSLKISPKILWLPRAILILIKTVENPYFIALLYTSDRGNYYINKTY